MVAAGILIAYFVVTTFLGFITSRKTADASTSEHFVASKGLTAWMIIPLLFGELIAGAGTVGNASSAFSSGLSSVWANWGMIAGCLLFLVTLIKFYSRAGSRGVMTVPESFKVRFDQKTKTVMMIITVIVYMIIYAMQPIAAAAILSPLLGVNYTLLVWIMSAAFVVFAITGGLKGLAKMNTLHAIVMYGGMIVVAIAAVNNVGGLQKMTETLPATFFSFVQPNPFTVFANVLGSALSFLTASTLVVVAFSAKSVHHARKGVLIASIAILPFALCPALVGMAAKVAMPEIAANQALFTMSNAVNPVFGGIAAMAIIAAILSTAPGLLLIISTTLTKDLYLNIKPKATEKQQMNFSTIAMIVLAIVCTIGGMNASSILNQILGAFQIRSITGVVLVVSILWKRVNSTAAFWSMAVGGLLAAVWHFSGNPFGWAPLWPSLVVGLLLLVILTLTTSKKPISDDYIKCEAYLNGETDSQL